MSINHYTHLQYSIHIPLKCQLLLIHLTLSRSAAMIHWTRQIKEVLSAQDALQTSENAGPIEEIQFWKNRCADLSGISEQLDKAGVKRITNILEVAKSSYVAPFLKLSGQIKVRHSVFL